MWTVFNTASYEASMHERIKDDKSFVSYDEGPVLYDPKRVHRVLL